jgi:uncharacterized protein (DUF1501 family)
VVKNARRELLRQLAASAAGIPSLTPLSLGPTVIEATDANQAATATLQNASNKTLVVIQLMGGNDGLNTVVPYGQPAYLESRPTVGLTSDEVLPIDADIGLNSQMSGLMDLYDSNRVAIIQGVSYPSPNLSHLEATAIWESATPEMPFSNGWLGRYMDVANRLETPATAINLGDLVPQTLQGVTSQPVSFDSLSSFQIAPLTRNDTKSQGLIQQLNEAACSACSEYNALVSQMMQSGLDAISASSVIQAAANSYTPQVTYPTDDFSARLKLAAGIIVSSLNPKIVYVTLGGFDTHGDQRATQYPLLKQLSDGVSAFYNDLAAQGRANDTIMMTFSEFGRRVKENGSRGTDHGTALPQFMIGGSVSPGLYGTYPDLTDLDANGNLLWNIDFRQSYATILEDWFGIQQMEVLGSTYQTLSVV